MASAPPRLIGMVHLKALPGAPEYAGDMARVISDAVRDAVHLADAGFEALIVENYGDAPFFAEEVPAATVAAMTRVVASVMEAAPVPTGVNVLRNDARAALAVAAATGASMVRVNVLSGTMYTDQGMIVGRAAEVARLRHTLCPGVAVLADVFVKHATPPPGLRLEQAVHDLSSRSGADVIVVSGSATGAAVDLADVRTARSVTDLPVYVGSGVTADNVAELLAVASGVIVGTALKARGMVTAPVDPGRAEELVAAAG